MTFATGEFSIAALSQKGIRPVRDGGREVLTSRRLLTTEGEPLEFNFGVSGLQVTLEGSGNEPSSLWMTFKCLRDIAALEDNWDSYGAKRIGVTVLRRTVSQLAILLPSSAPTPSVVPTSDGGLQFEWHRSGIDVEVTIPPEDPITYFIADTHTGEEVEGEGTPDRSQLEEAFAKMAQAA